MMTDPPTDDTEAREPDAPDTTDVKHRAPLHGHTGAVPPDKAFSDTLCTQPPAVLFVSQVLPQVLLLLHAPWHHGSALPAEATLSEPC